MKGQENGRATTKNRRIWKLVLLALGIALLFVGGRYAYVMFMDPMSAFEAPPAVTPSPRPAATQVPAKSDEAPLTPTPEPTLSPEEELLVNADMSFMKNKVNILMLGWDQAPEREDEDSVLYRDKENNYRSDVIMLMTVDFEKGTVDLISVPRDTYAPIYNKKGRWKINAAFAHGGSAEGEGFLYAMKTVENLLGVPIDYYAGVDMTGLKAIVDAMGGVDYDVDVEIRLNGRVLTTGMQHLDGQQVLDYVRARKGISTDVGRADRQQRMLFAIFEQLKSRNQLVNLPKIYASVQDKINTNLNSEQIAAMTVFAMGLDMEDLRRHTLEGEYISNVYNASFYVLDNDKLKKLVKEIYGIDIKTNPRYDLDYVRADKAAFAAISYAKGAEYLLGPEENAMTLTPKERELREPVEAAMAELLQVAERNIPADAGEETVEKLTASSLDKKAIEQAQFKLADAMYTYCIMRNITQAQVDKKMLPEAFYELLPAGVTTQQPVSPSQTPPAANVEAGELPEEE